MAAKGFMASECRVNKFFVPIHFVHDTTTIHFSDNLMTIYSPWLMWLNTFSIQLAIFNIQRGTLMNMKLELQQTHRENTPTQFNLHVNTALRELTACTNPPMHALQLYFLDASLDIPYMNITPPGTRTSLILGNRTHRFKVRSLRMPWRSCTCSHTSAFTCVRDEMYVPYMLVS